MSTYIFYKNGDLERPRSISESEFHSASYGQSYSYSPIDAPLRPYIFSGSSDFSNSSYKRVRSLKNIINRNSAIDPIYDWDSIYNKPVSILAISSYHLGSGIEKGSIQLSIYLTGSLIARATDSKENGVLYDASGNKVGFALYREGFIFLTNTASIEDANRAFTYNRDVDSTNSTTAKTSWYLFGSSNNDLVFEPFYDVTNTVPTNVTFTYADKKALNHSNNPTFIDKGQRIYQYTSSNSLVETKTLTIKKTNKSEFVSGSADFEKQTFITKVGLYDKEKKLIAVGSLANPIRKTENREFTIKLKIDF